MNVWKSTIATMMFAWSCVPAWGQVAATNIDDVIRQQRENEARHAARMAPVVERQLQINHPDDPALARQMYDSWKAASHVQSAAAADAARAYAARGAAADPAESRARDETARTELERLRRIQTQVGDVIDHVEGVLQRDAPDAAAVPPAADRGRGQLVLPTTEDGLLLYQLPREDLDLRAMDGVLRKAEAIRRAEAAANAANLEAGTAPGTAPGTDVERLLQAIQDEFDGGLRDAVGPVVDFRPDDFAGRVPNAVEIQAIMTALASCQARIADHNAREPNPPSGSLPEAEYKYWEGVIAAYNSEARALNSEQAELYGRLDAATR